MTVTIEYTKKEMVHKLNKLLGWSTSILNSFKEEELHNIHNELKEDNIVKKAKVRVDNYKVMQFKVPTHIGDALNLTYGDWLKVRVNVKTNELILYKAPKGNLKVGAGRVIRFPVIISAKQLLKPNDDAMIVLKDNRIHMKSFFNMQ